MAHFAEVDNANKVIRVVVVSNNDAPNEAAGASFCQSLFGGTWVQTSFNANIRKNYAGVGFTYDSDRDAFIPPKPYESWILNDSTCKWEAPVAKPDDGNQYIWDEATLSWVEGTL